MDLKFKYLNKDYIKRLCFLYKFCFMLNNVFFIKKFILRVDSFKVIRI